MKEVTVVKASHVQPFINYLEKAGAPIEEYLEFVGLCKSQLAIPDNLIPEGPVWELLEHASIQLEMPDLGYRISESLSLDTYGVFGEYVMSAQNLETSLRRFIDSMGVQSNCPKFWLLEENNVVWFCRKGTPGITRGAWQIEQHVLSLMIYLVKDFVDKNWSPKQVKLKTEALATKVIPSLITDSVITHGNSYTAIAIEQKYLSYSSNNRLFTKEIEQQSISGKCHEIILKLFKQGFFKEQYLVERIAKNLSMEVRQLQRIFQKEGQCLSTLINNVKFEQAKNLLSQNNRSVIEVSLELGYKDSANFSRAFKRWSGISPSQFKRINN